MSLIRPQMCQNCKYAETVTAAQGADTALECRRYPPHATAILVPAGGNRAMIQVHASPPQVPPDFWCGEHVPRIAIAANDNVVAMLNNRLAA